MARHRLSTGFHIKDWHQAEEIAGNLMLRLSQRQIDGLKRLAQEHDRTITYIIRAAIDAMIAASQSDSES